MGVDGEKERMSAEITRSGAVSPSEPILPVVNPAAVSEKRPDPPASNIHPAFYVSIWITLSSSIIIFNKWILDDRGFHYPVTLTCWHLFFATVMTQIMSRTTTLLDGRKTVKMTGKIYLRAIVPIGAFFSLSLICGNITYLYLNVAFIQMLKATTPVAVLLAGWALGTEKANVGTLFKVSFIVIGVIIASFGEIEFVFIGFMFQLGGIVFEALRLVMVQKLLSSAEYKMDPLVSLYYFAPICAVMNFCVAAVIEIPYIKMEEVYHVGLLILLTNACIAFALNVSVVFLIGRTSSLVLTLCGVLKDILLVVAAIAIWGKEVTPLQFFGYSIALGGLIYFKLGAETLKAKLSDAGRTWADYGVRHPALRKIIVFVDPVVHVGDLQEPANTLTGIVPAEPQSVLSIYKRKSNSARLFPSYDNWHVFGIKYANSEKTSSAPVVAPGVAPSSASSRSSPGLGPRPSHRYRNTSSEMLSELASTRTEQERSFTPVIARVSAHILRLEREYHLGKAFIQTSDPDCNHTVRLMDLTRLPARQSDSGPLAVEIFESPGRNFLRDLTDFGPAWYVSRQQSIKDSEDFKSANTPELPRKLPLGTFLDFAIGASECLELLHHGLKVVHGELRADAFHFNRDTGVVRLINYGSGPRSFEHAGGLTSSGWSTLSRQTGIKNRLMFIAPEQTGRTSADPDYRTDIYSLGILFWTMLAGGPAYDGLTPMEIMQAVLAKRVPPISNLRFDVPDVLSGIIQRMTQKQIDDRYHSASGLKYDLAELKRILSEGDSEALINFQIGAKDVSSSFVLPTTLLGRSQERKRIIQAMERVVRRQQALHQKDGSRMNSMASTTASTISDHDEGLETATRSSDVSSQDTKEVSVSPAVASNSSADAHEQAVSPGGEDSSEISVTVEKPPLETNASRESVETMFSADSRWSGGTRNTPRSKSLSTVMPKRPPKHRYGHRRRCEVIGIYGQAGLGKSSLIQTTQGEIRKLGYFTSAKFDPARRVPFETMLGAMAALFRQIFSESDIHTPYHNHVRASIRPIWPSMCDILDLPEHLVSMEAPGSARLTPNHNANKALQMEGGNSGSSFSTHSSNVAAISTGNLAGSQSMSDFLPGGASAYSSKLSSMFLEVMRILATSKLICLCLDDVQCADEESIDLICNILNRKLGLVIIFTCREPEQIPKPVRSTLDSGTANLTAITLAPLKETEVIDYVASTLSRSHEYVQALGVVCLEKTNGNPFYLKQMLEVCYRRGCVWYSWKKSAWEYNLDRVFAEFESDTYGEQLNSSFILKRLQDLPASSRAILAWGSLIGTTFSFPLVQRLLSGDFDLIDTTSDQTEATCARNNQAFSSQLADTAVEGLQAAMQAYILMPTDDEHLFSFSHDRYVQASASLRECQDVEKMHFYIAQTLMRYFCADHNSLHTRAQHICQAASLIKEKVQHRSRYREALSQAAQRAIDAGARPTALQYLSVCLNLMQPQPWKEGPDVYYEETLDVFSRAAQLYWHQGDIERAMRLASDALEATSSPADRAPLWIITSRLLSQQGDLAGAFQALKTSMVELGVDWQRSLTLDELDVQFENRKRRVLEADEANTLIKPPIEDPARAPLGAVLTEAISAAFWSDATTDPYTYGRSLALNAMFVDGFRSPIRDHIPILEQSIEYAQVSGDKHLLLMATALIASCRLWQGDDMAEIENFCDFEAEDFGNWSEDVRGGTYLTAVRQTARALQGKTYFQSAETIFSDREHDSENYLRYVDIHASNPERPRDVYHSMMMIPLYLFGYYDKAIEIGSATAASIHQLWSVRNSRLNLFYLSLSLIAKIRDRPSEGEQANVRSQVQEYKAQIDAWQTESSVNYLMWSLLIEAELADLTGEYDTASLCYEAAIDHTQLYEFFLEQALAFELQGEFFMRKGSKRAARSVLLDSVATYARMGASGKADHLRAKHEWLLSNALNIRSVDAEVQTTADMGNAGFSLEEPAHQRDISGDRTGDRTNDWISPKPVVVTGGPEEEGGAGADVSGLGLDVLDLQSILEFNQAISSELQIDRLLGKMTEIILESAGAQADLACVVVEGEGGWNVAAIGTSEGINAEAVPLSELSDETQKQVLLYTMRFKETVFVHNVLNDDRFCNTGATRSVISLPILQGNEFLGVLYLEGQPQSFTDRNVGVLQLFCNQVSISISNALLFKKIRKVSAANASMIEAQKLALAKARDAELKAKSAEAEAMKSVREKEEAAKAKSMFLANVSHELRTPLNGVIGMSELLKGTALDPEQEGYTDSIKVCADTLLTVINDILDFSKLEAGKLSLFSVPMNLKATINEVVRALSQTNAKKGLQTIVDLDLDGESMVMGDPVRIHQIFMNLLSNSYKFTAKGSVTVRARTEYADTKSTRVTCSIIDTGIGVTQEQVSRLFKPFSQADSSTQRSYGGSGLGLSICKALISVLNGKIWLESQVGVGTTVSFTIGFQRAQESGKPMEIEKPVSEPDPMATWSSDADGLQSKGVPTTFVDLSKIPRDQLRICIAEDNPINQKIAVSFVTKLGFKSEAFSDGLQAVEALRRNSADGKPFHLVLMDVQMPVLDGYDATRLIRKDADPLVRSVLIIAMTASAIRGDREKCIDAGMNNYLAKPVRANVLKTMLEGYLNQDAKPMTGLQETANQVAKEAIKAVAKDDLKRRARAGGTKAVEAIATATATANGISKGKGKEHLVQRPKVDAGDAEVQEWPIQLRRPPFSRGVSSSADSTETVRGPTREGDRA
ncbi:MAG: hypothetical protein Q9184_001443 [Pyrenodesmia sp. 2 TL-2023]